MSERYSNLKIILDKIMRHPLLTDLTYEAVVDYTVDFMRIVGVPQMFSNKVSLVEISNYRGILPCDWVDTIQIRDTKTGFMFRYATDNFHLSKNRTEPSDYTFMVQGNIIYTSVEEGEIEISYTAIQVDEDGIPMVPDDSKFYRALQAYIKKEWFTILFDMGKISTQAYQQAQQDYAWAVGACETNFHRLDLSKAESFFNSFRTLFVRDSEYAHGFRENGAKELLKKH